jgi:hypothetical protein
MFFTGDNTQMNVYTNQQQSNEKEIYNYSLASLKCSVTLEAV